MTPDRIKQLKTVITSPDSSPLLRACAADCLYAGGKADGIQEVADIQAGRMGGRHVGKSLVLKVFTDVRGAPPAKVSAPLFERARP